MAKKIERQPSLVEVLAAIGAGGGGGVKPLGPEDMIARLQAEGYRITRHDPTEEKQYQMGSSVRFEGGSVTKFAVVSDTQLGSKKQQLTFLNECYDRFEDLGIKIVYHCGDLVDGDGRVYPGQSYDLFLYGYDLQLEYAAEKYPRRLGIETFLIGGNHDWSFHQRGGADILANLAKLRPDIKYLGYGASQVRLDGLRIQLIHLKSGLTYARSYKLQKIIEQMAPEQKADMLFAGDRHSWAHVPMYRNVYGWQCGCFQAQTDHEKRLGLYPEIGALIVEVHHGSKGADKRDTVKPGHEGRPSVVTYTHSILPMYVPKENDF